MVVCCSTVVSERLSPERREREVWLLSCLAQSGALWAAVVNWSRSGRQELHYWFTTMTRVLSTAVLLQRENDRERERERERERGGGRWKLGRECGSIKGLEYVQAMCLYVYVRSPLPLYHLRIPGSSLARLSDRCSTVNAVSCCNCTSLLCQRVIEHTAYKGPANHTHTHTHTHTHSHTHRGVSE